MDFAQARMFNYGHGRFTSPDNFTNDTHPTDPSSWNLYVYARNNPLKFIDPSGEKAKVTIDKEKGTIKIEASFVVYGADGQGVTEEELNEQKDLIKSQIEKTLAGEYTDGDGNKYTISASITVETATSEKDAIKKVSDDVAGNIVEVGNKGITDKQEKRDLAYATAFSRKGEDFDRVMVSLVDDNKKSLKTRNTHAHEFIHLLGVSGHSTDNRDLRGTGDTRPSLTNRDKSRLFGEQVILNASSWTRRARRYPEGHRRWLK